jgi:hypothetical protein
MAMDPDTGLAFGSDSVVAIDLTAVVEVSTVVEYIEGSFAEKYHRHRFHHRFLVEYEGIQIEL